MYYIMDALEILLDKSNMCNISSLAFLGSLVFILVEIFLILAIMSNSQLNFGHMGYYFMEWILFKSYALEDLFWNRSGGGRKVLLINTEFSICLLLMLGGRPFITAPPMICIRMWRAASLNVAVVRALTLWLPLTPVQPQRCESSHSMLHISELWPITQPRYFCSQELGFKLLIISTYSFSSPCYLLWDIRSYKKQIAKTHLHDT